MPASVDELESILETLAPAPADAESAPTMAREELISAWASAKDLEGKTQWTLGDIALEALRSARQTEPDIPESDVFKAFSSAVGEEYSTLRSYAWVSKAFPTKEMRKTGLSWSHYRKTINTNDPMSWIELAVEENLTVRELEQRISEADKKENPEVYRCTQCGKPLPLDGIIAVTRSGKKEAEFDTDECALAYFSNVVASKAVNFGKYSGADMSDLNIPDAETVFA